MTGLYLSTINYDTDSPLKLKFHLGYKHQPQEYNDFHNDSGVIPGVSLLYQLSSTQVIGLSYGINETNNQIYNYLSHDQKPFNLWYEGSFLNNSFKVNVNVSNYNNFYYDQYSNFNPWQSSRRLGFDAARN